ncbi:MAG TPA: hypothetical protein VMH86_01410 [Rhizomicrobium sp.]|nr:hypothetical protein [Rhizomicrobium sp.]
MRMKTWIALIQAAMISMLLCATADAAPVETKKMSEVHTVAIIAALGNEAKYQRVGIMVFGNESGPVDISQWGLDDILAGEMTAALQDHYKVKTADFDHNAFATANEDDGNWFSSNPTLYDLIVQRNDRALVDAYIVVVRGGLQDVIGGTNQPLIGLGMYRHPFGLSGHVVADYAIFDVYVVDSYTCKEIARSQLILGEDQSDNPEPPIRQASESDFPENYSDLTDTQRNDLRQTAIELLKAATRPTLSHLGFQVEPEKIH